MLWGRSRRWRIWTQAWRRRRSGLTPSVAKSLVCGGGTRVWAASVRGVAPVHRGGTGVGGGAPDAGVEAAAAASRDGTTTPELGEALELRQAL